MYNLININQRASSSYKLFKLFTRTNYYVTESHGNSRQKRVNPEDTAVSITCLVK